MQITSSPQLNIGCSTKCGVLYQRALKEAARDSGVKLKIHDLSSDDRIHWEKVDAILIPDGPDINPCYYYSSIEKDLRDYTKKLTKYYKTSARSKKRDAFEHGLLMEYFHNKTAGDLPVLGISRGMQMIAVSQGIPLYVDIAEELGIRSPRLRFDKVKLKGPNSLMNSLAEGKSFMAPKLQHQAIRSDYFYEHHRRWPNVELTAFSHEDQLAEAIEFQDRPILGIQFHAEMGFNHQMKNVFKWLVEAARERHQHLEENQMRYAS